jgi:uncharacterized protein YjbI with pentapeptide repeats
MLEIKHGTTREILLQVEGDSWEGRDLSGAQLDEAHLINLRLMHSMLRGTSLRRADLSGSLLNNACLDGAVLERARLAGTDLTSASLVGANLTRADLRRSVLRYATLSGADCAGANLQKADLSMCDARANFRGASMIGCDLRGANLAGANLQQADLTGADLTDANIAGAVFVGAKLQGAKMPPAGDQRTPAAALSRTPAPRPLDSRPTDTQAADAAVQDFLPSIQPPSVDSQGKSPAPKESRTGEPSPKSSKSSKPKDARQRNGGSSQGRTKGEATWMTRSGPDFDSLLISCPECGFTTRLNTQVLDGSYRCRACQCLFSLDKSGKVKPPKTKRTVPWEPRREPSKVLGRLTQLAIVLVVVGSLVLLGGLIMQLTSSLSGPVSLTDRSVYVAKAFMESDVDALAKVSTKSEAASFVEIWLKKRPDRWKSQLNGKTLIYKPDVVGQGASSALTKVLVSIPAANAGENLEKVEINLAWIPNDRGEWLLDLPGTLKGAPTQY